jgi:hypothetical protein
MTVAKEAKTARKSSVIALEIICIILVAALAGVIVAFTFIINDKNNTISLLDSQIEASTWVVNKTVVVEGNLTLRAYPPSEVPPWNYVLISGNQEIGVLWEDNVPNDSAGVKVTGVVRQGVQWIGLPPSTETVVVYYIEAKTVEQL